MQSDRYDSLKILNPRHQSTATFAGRVPTEIAELTITPAEHMRTPLGPLHPEAAVGASSIPGVLDVFDELGIVLIPPHHAELLTRQSPMHLVSAL